MYTLQIRESRTNLATMLIRALLALASLTSLVITSNSNYWINRVAAVVLLLLALFIDLLLEKWVVKKILLLLVASIVLLVATNSFIIALCLFLFGMLSSYFNPSHRIHINEQLIELQNGIFGKSYYWTEFSNVILKDELLTLDFKNNRLIQLVVDVNCTPVNEIEFNEFCRILLETGDSSMHS